MSGGLFHAQKNAKNDNITHITYPLLFFFCLVNSDSGDPEAPAPLSIHATVKATGVTYPSPMVIFAEASRGGDPVLGLKVGKAEDEKVTV